MSYEFYKVLHIAGILILFFGLVGLATLKFASGSNEMPAKQKRQFFLMHGIGLFLSILGGFGLAARLGIASQMPMWVWMKVAIWLLLGAGISIAKRRGQLGAPVLMAFWILGIIAAWIAINKPGV